MMSIWSPVVQNLQVEQTVLQLVPVIAERMGELVEIFKPFF